jgi:exodeoxyribonuclease X
MRVLLADTETTGFDHEADQIIEAAWLELPKTVTEFCAIRDPMAFTFFEQRYKPSVPMNFGAQATHHILPHELEGCPSTDEFSYPADVDYLIGHNIDFDAKFFAGAMDDRRICTLALSRWLFPDLDSHTQSAMIYFIASQFGTVKAWEWARGALRDAHSALADVRICSALLRYLVACINARSDLAKVEHWEQLHIISEVARVPTRMDFGKHKGELVADVPASYAAWYLKQDDQDPYLLKAFRQCGKIK